MHSKNNFNLSYSLLFYVIIQLTKIGSVPKIVLPIQTIVKCTKNNQNVTKNNLTFTLKTNLNQLKIVSYLLKVVVVV